MGACFGCLRITNPDGRPRGGLVAAVLATLLSVATCRGPAVPGPGPGPEPEPAGQLVEFSGETMGTWYSIKVVGPPGSIGRESLEREIQETLDGVDSRMSTYRTDSELVRLNRVDSTDWVDVSADMAAVVGEAIRVGELSGGAFDVTVGPLVNLWNFGPLKNVKTRVPTDEEIDEVRQRIGISHLEVRQSPPGVRKGRGDLSIDLSGVAKGFAVDQVAEQLDRGGIENYMVEVGGELRARGHNRGGKPWRIGVELPRATVREVCRVVPLSGLGMATSGDYRNYFEKDGVRYSHLIDPRVGRPIGHRLASVTVLAPACMEADAMATALMVLGPEAGHELALGEALPALFLIRTDRGFVEKATPEFEKLVEGNTSATSLQAETSSE